MKTTTLSPLDGGDVLIDQFDAGVTMSVMDRHGQADVDLTAAEARILAGMLLAAADTLDGSTE